jgi:hypothetical protein
MNNKDNKTNKSGLKMKQFLSTVSSISFLGLDFKLLPEFLTVINNSPRWVVLNQSSNQYINEQPVCSYILNLKDLQWPKSQHVKSEV